MLVTGKKRLKKKKKKVGRKKVDTEVSSKNTFTGEFGRSEPKRFR